MTEITEAFGEVTLLFSVFVALAVTIAGSMIGLKWLRHADGEHGDRGHKEWLQWHEDMDRAEERTEAYEKWESDVNRAK